MTLCLQGTLSLSRLVHVLTLACVLLSARSEAQTRAPDATRELKLLESTERGLDPLGLDESTGKELDEAARRLEEARRKAALVPPPSAEVGNVLSAIPGVAEATFSQRVSLDQGLAFVRVAIRLESRAVHPAQVAYRLALPRGAAVSKVGVCKRGVCVQAGVGEARAALHGASPDVRASRIDDRNGAALSLLAASVEKGAPLELSVEYAAPAEVHGGSVRFWLPVRGYDPRIVEAMVEVSAGAGLAIESPEGAVTLDPARGLWVVARLTKDVAIRTRSSCGGAACSRTFEAAPLRPLLARETWLLLDASPSMEGNARNRADVLLSSLLATMPAESPLRVFAFGARAERLGSFVAQAAPLKPLSDALTRDLGSATRPGSVLGAEPLRARPLVLLVSDAKLDATALRSLSVARDKGAELWLLNVGDAGAGHKAFEGVIDVAPLWAETFGDGGSEQLEALLRAPFSRRAGQVRKGEQRVREQAKDKLVPRSSDTWLSFWLSRAAPVSFTSARHDGAYIAAPPFIAAPPPAPAADTGMPKESVLSMLRTQLIPQARGCLRSDRKGRADYAVQVTFHALFAEREAYDVRVEGKIEEALRGCLLDVVERLRVPAFTGRIRVRYPIYTEREQVAPVIELVPEAEREVDRVIRGK